MDCNKRGGGGNPFYIFAERAEHAIIDGLYTYTHALYIRTPPQPKDSSWGCEKGADKESVRKGTGNTSVVCNKIYISGNSTDKQRSMTKEYREGVRVCGVVT
jgi:hypothetical protein